MQVRRYVLERGVVRGTMDRRAQARVLPEVPRVTQTAIQRRLVRLAGAMNAKAIRLGVRGRVTAMELAQIQIESEDVCFYCGIKMPADGGSFDQIYRTAHRK